MVGHPARTMLRKDDVVESSQLVTGEHSALAEVTCMEMHGTMMDVLQAERSRAPIAPAKPELQWVSNDVLNILDHDTVM